MNSLERATAGSGPKHVLVVYYSQTGQLERILNSLLGPLERDSNVRIERIKLAAIAAVSLSLEAVAVPRCIP